MKALKWIGIILVGLLLLLIITGAAANFWGKSRLNNAPEIATRPVAAASGDGAVEHGKHLATTVSSCTLCPGVNLSGDVIIDGEMGFYATAPNLTSGAGGIGAAYSDADWERAIRHGVGSDGRVLVIMPTNFYQHYSDEDLADLIAYLKSVPPVDNDLGPRRVGFPGSIIGGFVAFDDFTRINAIDHASVGAESPQPGVTADYGRYMTEIAVCGECHAANLAGIVGEDGPPPGPNLTPGGELGNWSEADFMAALRSGQTPSGKTLDPEQMPWTSFSNMTDSELQAIWAYLSTLPALPDNS